MTVCAVEASSYDDTEVRRALLKGFQLLGFDADNPLGYLIKPGATVFIKPNWVAHRYRASCREQYSVFTTITHPSVIAAVAKFVDKALDGKGKIIIGDNPSIDADFDALLKIQQLDRLKLQSELRIYDLRPLLCSDLKFYGLKHKMSKGPGDPMGETMVNLGQDSLFYGLNPRLFRGVFTDRTETLRSHSGTSHLYSFSNSIFHADVYISIPKLKTHHKTGVTLNLKGLVGTVSNKNLLVHWREGFPGIGGDAYPNFLSWLADRFRKVKKRGAWPGNDTIWRMVVDLYKAFQKGPKKFFSVIDGILGGEGNGPFCPEPKDSRILILGTDLLETDIVATRLMGFQYRHIKYLDYLIKEKRITPQHIDFISDLYTWADLFESHDKLLDFKPPHRWTKVLKYS